MDHNERKALVYETINKLNALKGEHYDTVSAHEEADAIIHAFLLKTEYAYVAQAWKELKRFHQGFYYA